MNRMNITKINELIHAANEKASMTTGNYYILFVDDLKSIEHWLLFWTLTEYGYYQIYGQNIFIIQSSLNTLIDITDKF